ncbi:hypothetical protein Salat_0968400 [Sesamum alatum]|uniref:ARGOS-like protein n=1 Tax=Sesamum alatum TaxID=300844 RepID=A0AAE2CRR9_9LAMI|nr:hypothetical protein Salat_0968400 [Sesamum alatum]
MVFRAEEKLRTQAFGENNQELRRLIISTLKNLMYGFLISLRRVVLMVVLTMCLLFLPLVLPPLPPPPLFLLIIPVAIMGVLIFLALTPPQLSGVVALMTCTS